MGRIPQMEIIRRAYKIWEDNGKQEGRDDEFYRQAQRELEAEAEAANAPPEETRLE